jgi:hypothetical protein
MNKLPIILKLVIVIAIASVLFSCTPKAVNLETLDPNSYDQSWLTGKPCGAPCWYGLEPGVSTRQDSITKAKQLSFINGNGGMPSPSNASWVDDMSFPCKVPDDKTCSVMNFVNGSLTFIWIIPNYSITIDQVVEKLGNPDGFSAYPTDPGATGCNLDIVWKEKQLVLEYIEYKSDVPFWSKDLCTQIHDNKGKIPRGLIVQDVLYASPDYIKRMMNNSSWYGYSN